MDLSRLPSVSEVYGEAGSGRTSFCLAMASPEPSLWIQKFPRFPSARALSVQLDLEEVFVSQTHSVNRLLHAFRSGEVSVFVRDHGIRLIVINTLSDFFYAAKGSSGFCVALVQELKRLYTAQGVKSLLISDGMPIKRILSGFIPVSSSVAWNYALPARFLVSKSEHTGEVAVTLEKPAFQALPAQNLKILSNKVLVLSKDQGDQDFETTAQAPGALHWEHFQT
ncbi:hypothetical protein NEDG_01536 [Nematocida displodere]|uniref:DNA recombination and repair protein Rad51-like C-terminal domain-containing protein n=1 Tax=Nematocida displodere TaxID=1805483 RepID=A0A177EG63_9MICR|nr:hypothetical protein NEDG_01536 [Nematocida displodere]